VQVGAVTDFDISTGAGSLLDAVLLISSGLDLRGSLERLVQASCALTDARYGVLGLLDSDGIVADYVIHGLDGAEMSAIATLPTCEGVLGVVIEDPRPLRVANVADHARSMGFPPNHPPMSSFLGVPVRVDGKVYGNLYLTEKADGRQFTETDESLLDVLAQVAGHVIANARTHSETEQRNRWLAAGIAMSDALADSSDPLDALALVAAHLRRAAGAIAVGVVHTDGAEIDLVAGNRRDGAEMNSLDLAERWAAAISEARLASRPTLVRRGDGITRVVVPMPSRLLPGQFLLVALDDAELGVDGPDLDRLAAFADQASLSLDRTQALAERQEHMLTADRDRIARDLHDSVIQRLFATALQLQGLRRTVVLDDVRGRLDEAVAELNTTIRDIRSTIFELRHDDGTSLKYEIRALVKEYVPVLGFTPFVRIRGPVDVAVSEELSRQLIASLREALSNVARHAEADACVVEVEVTGIRLLLRVSDNGRGIGETVSESGLRNVRRRATDLGGVFRIVPEDPHGTLLEWQVPLA
jgi:signal transduction histidine kinase